MSNPDPDLLSLNTATVRAQWKLPEIIAGCARHGIRGIAPWRDQVAATGLDETAQRIRDAGLTVTGLCRGGMFPAADREAAMLPSWVGASVDVYAGARANRTAVLHALPTHSWAHFACHAETDSANPSRS